MNEGCVISNIGDFLIVTFHVSHVTCHMSCVTCHIFFFYNVVKLIGGGFVINGAYPV